MDVEREAAEENIAVTTNTASNTSTTASSSPPQTVSSSFTNAKTIIEEHRHVKESIEKLEAEHGLDPSVELMLELHREGKLKNKTVVAFVLEQDHDKLALEIALAKQLKKMAKQQKANTKMQKTQQQQKHQSSMSNKNKQRNKPTNSGGSRFDKCSENIAKKQLTKQLAYWGGRWNQLQRDSEEKKARAKKLRKVVLNDAKDLILPVPVVNREGQVVGDKDTLEELKKFASEDIKSYSTKEITRATTQGWVVSDYDDLHAQRCDSQLKIIYSALPPAMMSLSNNNNATAAKTGSTRQDTEHNSCNSNKMLQSEKDIKKHLNIDSIPLEKVTLHLQALQDAKTKCETIRQANSTPIIAQQVADKYDISSRTVASYYAEYLLTNERGFHEDMRGKHKRENILEALKLEQSLRSHLRSLIQQKDRINTGIIQDYLNRQISALVASESNAKNEGIEVASPTVVEILEKHRVSVPISRNTAYRAMLFCDARFVKFQHSYFNDVHESKATIDYRNNFYLPKVFSFQQRQPCWATIPLDKASEDAIEDAKVVWNVPESQEIDTFTVESSQGGKGSMNVECCQVHVDYLCPGDYDDIRVAHLKANEVSGEYHRRFARTDENGKYVFLWQSFMQKVQAEIQMKRNQGIDVDENKVMRISHCPEGHTPHTCLCHLPLHR